MTAENPETGKEHSLLPLLLLLLFEFFCCVSLLPSFFAPFSLSLALSPSHGSLLLLPVLLCTTTTREVKSNPAVLTANLALSLFLSRALSTLNEFDSYLSLSLSLTAVPLSQHISGSVAIPRTLPLYSSLKGGAPITVQFF